MRWGVSRTRLAVLVTVCLAGAATAAGAAHAQRARAGASPLPNVRVLGRFLMTSRVTVAVGIPGEYVGEIVKRTWRIRPDDCRESDCPRLVIVRNRGQQRESKLQLRRIGTSLYRGTGTFWAPLRCQGRTFGRGSLVPYVVRLKVVDWTQVGPVRYATAVAASYRNARRSDRTKCPIGVVHDAAVYSGVLKSKLPAAPVPVPTTPTAPVPTAPVPTAPVPTPVPTTPAPAPTAPVPTAP